MKKMRTVKENENFYTGLDHCCGANSSSLELQGFPLENQDRIDAYKLFSNFSDSLIRFRQIKPYVCII